jgi:hypothetical protein
MNPLSWFASKFGPKATSAIVKAAPKVAPKGGPLLNARGLQQINTNMNVPGGVPMGGLPGAAVLAAGDALIPHISREAVRGGIVVTGGDPTDFDRMNAGQPVVRNVGGVSYNISTPEGKSGYRKAVFSGEKPSVPAEPAVSRAVNLPPSAAIPGEGPKGNEVGSDADPDTPGLQGPGAVITPGRPSEVEGGISTKATVALDLEAANGLLSRGGSSENPNRFLAEGTQMADINSFLPATIPVSGNEKPSAPVDQSESTQLGGDVVAEGVVTQQKPKVISADGADNTRSVSVPGEPEGPTNWMDRGNSADSFLAARRAAFLNLDNRGYGAIRAADAATGRFRQGDKFFYNDAGTMREVDEQTWRKGQHQAINPMDEMEEGSKFMEGWKDSKIKPTLVPSEQTDITNPDADGGQSPVVSDFNENNIGPVADADVYGEHLKRAREKTKS